MPGMKRMDRMVPMMKKGGMKKPMYKKGGSMAGLKAMFSH